jgi:predicted ATPase
MILFQEQDLVEGDFCFNRHSMEVIQKHSVLKLASEEGLLEATIDSKIYKFAHDKIREVLYEDLMPDLLERQHLHRRIGHLIWEYLKSGHAFQESDEWSIFLAANNVNNALTLIDDSYERYKTVSINLSAGKAAVAKLDFSLASVYLCTALDLLEGYVSWEFHYELCIDLFSTAAEVEKINSRYDRSDELVKKILKKEKNCRIKS